MQKPDEFDLPMGVPLLLDSFTGGTLDSGRVTHVLFADDLVICELSQHRTQVQISRLAEYPACKGLTVNVDKCALMVCNDKRLSGRADQVVLYQGVRIPVVDGFKYVGLWMDRHMNMREAATRTRGGSMAAWRELVPVAINAGVRYMPHAMVLLVKTYVFQHATFASQVWGVDLLHPSPCGEFDLQSEILSIFRRLLALRGSVARASLMDELGVHPLQVHWLKA
jgi:hypothetical protein